MKERQKRQRSQTSSAQPVVFLSLFVSNGGAFDEMAQITVELSSDELAQPQWMGILSSLNTDQDCACE